MLAESRSLRQQERPGARGGLRLLGDRTALRLPAGDLARAGARGCESPLFVQERLGFEGFSGHWRPWWASLGGENGFVVAFFRAMLRHRVPGSRPRGPGGRGGSLHVRPQSRRGNQVGKGPKWLDVAGKRGETPRKSMNYHGKRARKRPKTPCLGPPKRMAVTLLVAALDRSDGNDAPRRIRRM